VASGELSGDSRLSGVSLFFAGREYRGSVSVRGGSAGEDVLDGRRSFEEFAAHAGEGVEKPTRVWFGEGGADRGPLMEGHRFVIAAECDVQYGQEDAALGAEQPVDRRDWGLRGLGDRLDRGRGVAVGDESLLGSGDHRGSRRAG